MAEFNLVRELGRQTDRQTEKDRLGFAFPSPKEKE